jgi:7,8-dihydropterin-6-yl-methyl-4-(beta-D-ribofuranosyl)aminobenzene 5'-phosphate synthase
MEEDMATGTQSVKKLRIRCLSEVSWKDDGRMRLDIRESGGLDSDQYDVQWTEGNAAGVMNLLEVTDGAGVERKILVDVGWDESYVEDVLKREGVDRMLENGEIDMVYITHEHVDHFFALKTICTFNPDVTVVIPEGFTEKGLKRIGESGLSGELRVLPPGKKHELYPGLYSVTFDVPIFLRVKNEQVIYADLEGKGIVTVTGCCHPGIIDLLEYGRKEFSGKKVYGVYGGLHICPFDEWKPEHDALIGKLEGYRIDMYACNHCTGTVTVQKMREAGLNVYSGTGRFGSKTDAYVGCGDVVEF